jgi:hypothetical protein
MPFVPIPCLCNDNPFSVTAPDAPAFTVMPLPLNTEMPAYTPGGAMIDSDCVIVTVP